MSTRTIVVEYLGRDVSASKAAAVVGGSNSKLASSFNKLSAVAAGVLITAGVAAFKIGDSFDEMRNTIIVGTGASGKALEDLEASARNVGKRTPASFADIGTAIADLNTRLGLTGKPLEDMASRFLNLSRITKTDLAANISNATRVFGDWSIETKDQPAALDAIFEATKRTGIGLDELTTKVVQFGAPLRQFGFGFEESLALFGKWEKEGVNTQVVLSGLKMGLGRFSAAGREPAKALAQVTKAIADAGTTGEANLIAIENFGQRAGPDMAAAVREGRFELGDMVEALKNSEGALEDADSRTRTWRDSLMLLKNRVMIPLEPVAVKVFDTISAGALKAADFTEKHQTVTVVLAAAVVGLAAAVVAVKIAMIAFHAVMVVATAAHATYTAVVGLSNSILAVWVGVKALEFAAWARSTASTVAATAATVAHAAVTKAIIAVTRAWVVAQWLLNAALLANPIGIVIVLLAALAIGVVVAYKRSETFRNIVQGAWKVIGGAVRLYWNSWIKPALSAFMTALEAVGKAGKWLWEKALRPAFAFIVGGIGKLIAVWAAMLRGLARVPGFGWAKGAADAMQNAANKAAGLANEIRGIPPNKTVNINVNTWRRTFSKVPGLGWVDGIGNNAKGTSFWKGGATWVGEEGPEIVDLPRGSRVTPHRQSMARAGDGGGRTTLEVNFNGLVTDPRAVGRELVRVLREYERSSGQPLGLAF